jgi:isopentenyl-diphosphate delta-isomerase
MLTPGHTDAVDTRVVTIGRDGSLGGVVSRELAHLAPGVLHLAVSVQVVDPDGRWLLQRRADSKAAFAGRWANTCCTHPRLGEDPQQAAVRRVCEELGLVIAGLRPAGVFVYRAVDPVSGLVEHEVDHVFLAVCDTGKARHDPDEASELARVDYTEALRLVTSDEGAPWAGEVLRRAFDVLNEKKGDGTDVAGND